MPLHPQAKAVCDLANSTRVPVAPEDRVRLTREGWALYLTMTGGTPQPVQAVEDRDAGGVPVRVYRPSAEPNLPIFVVFHGGGWVIGSVEQYDGIARWIANASGAIVVSVDYRLAPEHPYPAPLDDCWHALQWTATHAEELGGDASRIAIGGDSAGGNLAAVCALLARDAGGPALALQALVYPVCDTDFGTASYVANGEGYLLDLDQMRWFVDCYTSGRVDPTDWHVSPLRVPSLAGVAPAVVLTAEYDPLRDEGEAYADRLREVGVAVEYRCFEGMIHSFFGLEAYDSARDAMDFVATELRRAFGTLEP
ncbi:MAG: acetyl esterase [Actinomycetota bacterium]|nr:acetyl esterase [Actinomycetota bacterium]